MSEMRHLRSEWHDCNMLMAVAMSTRSPDPDTQVGAYICTKKIDLSLQDIMEFLEEWIQRVFLGQGQETLQRKQSILT